MLVGTFSKTLGMTLTDNSSLRGRSSCLGSYRPEFKSKPWPLMVIRLPISQYTWGSTFKQKYANSALARWIWGLGIIFLSCVGYLCYFLLPTSFHSPLPALPPPCLFLLSLSSLPPCLNYFTSGEGKLLYRFGLLKLPLQGFRDIPGRAAACSFSESWCLGRGGRPQSKQGGLWTSFLPLKGTSGWFPIKKHVLQRLAWPLKGLSCSAPRSELYSQNLCQTGQAWWYKLTIPVLRGAS